MSKRTFISYSHDSQAHKDWVLRLATTLRKMGVDVVLDQWDVDYGDDLPGFMEEGITTSDRVIAVCTDQYIRKANESNRRCRVREDHLYCRDASHRRESAQIHPNRAECERRSEAANFLRRDVLRRYCPMARTKKRLCPI